jgi:hypothetical protein
MPKKMHRAKRYLARARSAAAGTKSSLVQGLVGGVAGMGMGMVYPKVEFFQKNWYAGPAVLGVIGHMVRRKKPGRGYGEAILGAAGYAMAMGYSLKQQAEAQQKQQAAPAEAGALLPAGGDAGALVEYDTGIAGYLDDARNPTSSFYIEPGTVPADDEAISEAMGL